MKYMLLLVEDPAAVPTDLTAGIPADDVAPDWVTYTRALADAGVLVAGDALHGSDVATTVRVRDGRRVVTDGPFAETTEMLIGYYIIDVDDLDAATDWAARVPHVRHGSVEVRPLMETAASASAATGPSA